MYYSCQHRDFKTSEGICSTDISTASSNSKHNIYCICTALQMPTREETGIWMHITLLGFSSRWLRALSLRCNACHADTRVGRIQIYLLSFVSCTNASICKCTICQDKDEETNTSRRGAPNELPGEICGALNLNSMLHGLRSGEVKWNPFKWKFWKYPRKP